MIEVLFSYTHFGADTLTDLDVEARVDLSTREACIDAIRVAADPRVEFAPDDWTLRDICNAAVEVAEELWGR